MQTTNGKNSTTTENLSTPTFVDNKLPVIKLTLFDASDLEYIEALRIRLGVSSNQEAIRIIIRYFKKVYSIS